MPNYKVKRGDTPSTIAEALTGDPQRHTELLDANPDFRAETKSGWRMLRSGDALAIPETWAEHPNPNALKSIPRGTRFPPMHTPGTAGEVFAALKRAAAKLFNDPMRDDSVAVLVSQWALETGWGQSCWNWNLGNVKAKEGDGLDFTYYPTWEVLTRVEAHILAANPGARADEKPGPNVVIASEDTSAATAVVWFYPDHFMCRFRSFRSLDEGAEEYLKVLFHRYRRAWSAVTIGDPSGFAAALKTHGYFTAPLDGPKGYRTALVSVYNRVVSQLAPNA